MAVNSDDVRQHVDSGNHGFMDQALSHAHRVCRSPLNVFRPFLITANQTVQQQGDIDEDGIQNLKNAHDQAFGSGGQGPQGMAPDAMGGAAAFKVSHDQDQDRKYP